MERKTAQATVVYYTSNKEDESFEKKITDDLLTKIGNLPIISVSQRPMNLGKNICVGDVGFSYQNSTMQLLIGAQEATTPFIISAESDFLYDAEYFKFIPPTSECYRHSNVWICYMFQDGGFHKKGESEGAQICGRDRLINRLTKHHQQFREQWSYNDNQEGRHINPPFHGRRRRSFNTTYACISIKTLNGKRKWTTLCKDVHPEDELPYWGMATSLKERLNESVVVGHPYSVIS